MASIGERPKSGAIVIQWTAGEDADDPGTYAWEVRCEPPLSDELVSAILAEIAAVY